jgi:hypothetical protein
MNHDVFFNQACPVCGRTLRVQVKLLGRQVYCQHCGGGFVAVAEGMHATDSQDRFQSRAEVIDDLLARASVQLQGAARSSCDDDLAG